MNFSDRNFAKCRKKFIYSVNNFCDFTPSNLTKNDFRMNHVFHLRDAAPGRLRFLWHVFIESLATQSNN
jgi:hypothetical protein